MQQLKLIALDKDDIEVVSTHLQDAVVKVADIVWLPAEKRLVLGLNRFDWEACGCEDPCYKRRRTALRFERVNAFRCRNVSPMAKDDVLNLLAIEFSETDAPGGAVTLTFSGTLTEFGSLIDGFYDFSIDAAEVSGAGGALDGNNDTIPGGSYAVTGDTTNKFFRLFGDADGSGITNLSDFAAFRGAFNLGANDTFDFDNSGNVDLADFARFRANFNLSP